MGGSRPADCVGVERFLACLLLPDIDVQQRPSEPIEVAAYYVAAEALANAAKHSQASIAHLTLQAHNDRLQLSIRDDGVGGATSGDGSGLVGLADRVEALGRTILVDSPPGQGTRLNVDLPMVATQSR